jgi:lipoic acid synthetase
MEKRELNNQQLPVVPTPKIPKPDWLKVKAPAGETLFGLKKILRSRNLHTVCEEARCPNVGECWNGGTATFMLMGDTCTRGCRFCAVKTLKNPGPLDPLEPQKIADAVAEMQLDYVVLTSVDRDDLPDQGAPHFAATVKAIKIADRRIMCECLIPDFKDNAECIATLVAAKPEVLAHNLETVRRLTPKVRDPRATYNQTLSVLRRIKTLDATIFTKSSIMIGLGETADEIEVAMRDLRDVGVDILTLGQYLQPTHEHLKVQEFVRPEVFEQYRRRGEELGFLYVASGPLVRSSYRAGEFFIKGILEKRREEMHAVI